jgi:enterochelin esterase-like enzyme
MVVQDGHSYINRMAPVLDNMIAAGRLPAMVIVAADSGGSDAQGSQRGLEYDTLSDRYSNWVEEELLPAVTKKYGVTFTTDPDGRGTLGGSSGGIAAFTMAWYHPERYHKVLSYSGTFVNQASPQDSKTPRGGWEYHATLIPKSAKKPIRIWMEVGEKDLHYDDAEQSWHNWPLANNRMAAALKKAGYDYKYVWARGARHVDPRVVMQTLPSALEWLWRDYPRS